MYVYVYIILIVVNLRFALTVLLTVIVLFLFFSCPDLRVVSQIIIINHNKQIIIYKDIYV